MSGMILSILHPILSKRAFRLSVSTAMNFSDNMQIKDVNGRPHPLTQYQVQMILILGWVSFILSWICNVISYKFHPSGVDFNMGRSKARLLLYFLGRKFKVEDTQKNAEEEEEATQINDEGGDEKDMEDRKETNE